MARDLADIARAPVSAGYARALLRRFGQSAAERSELISSVGFGAAEFDPAAVEMSVGALASLASVVTRRFGELWALDAPAVWSSPLQGALDLATRTAPTIRTALETGARYGPAAAPFLSVQLRFDANGARMTFQPALPLDGAIWRAIGYAVALNIHALFEPLLEEDVATCAFRFPWPEPDGAERLRAHFSCPLTFAADDFALVVPATTIERQSPFADAGLHAKALHSLEEMRRRVFGDAEIGDEVRRLIETCLPRRIDEQTASQMLRLSRRTLQRRLAAENLAFRDILASVLRERARDMLRSGGMSRDEMAAALGYSDATSFSRACRRWFGRGQARARA